VEPPNRLAPDTARTTIIPGRGPRVGMAHQLLERGQIHAEIQHIARERATQVVRREGLDVRLAGAPPHDVVNRLGRHALLDDMAEGADPVEHGSGFVAAERDPLLQREGLLPEPTRPAIPDKRRRGSLIFPEEAARVVVSLNHWRHRVSGVESARGYLWLEGYDYLTIDPEAELQTAREQVWNDLRSVAPSLPLAPDTPHDKEQREHILDELDTNVTARAATSLHLSETLFATLPVIFSLYNADEWQDIERVDSENLLLKSLWGLVNALSGPVLRADDEEIVTSADGPVYTMLADFGIPKWESYAVDWRFVRSAWQFICLASDIPEHLHNDRVRLFALFLR
jgi:hypothetical protein